jgi:hypothetical protein
VACKCSKTEQKFKDLDPKKSINPPPRSIPSLLPKIPKMHFNYFNKTPDIE